MFLTQFEDIQILLRKTKERKFGKGITDLVLILITEFSMSHLRVSLLLELFLFL